MNTYEAFYRKRRMTVHGWTSRAAQEDAAKAFKARKVWEVTVVLAAKDGEPVTHDPAEVAS